MYTLWFRRVPNLNPSIEVIGHVIVNAAKLHTINNVAEYVRTTCLRLIAHAIAMLFLDSIG